jgi:hypothetical protein
VNKGAHTALILINVFAGPWAATIATPGWPCAAIDATPSLTLLRQGCLPAAAP